MQASASRAACRPGSAARAAAVARLHQQGDDGMTASNVTRQCLLGHLALQHLAMLLNAAALQQTSQVLQAGSPLAHWEAYHRSRGAEPASSKQHALLRSWLAPRQQALLYMVGQSRLLTVASSMSVLISVLPVLWTLSRSLNIAAHQSRCGRLANAKPPRHSMQLILQRCTQVRSVLPRCMPVQDGAGQADSM